MGNSIQSFNEQLNHSLNENQRYVKWTTYRNRLSHFIGKHLEVCGDVQKLMVVGAGGCNDLDLNLLKSFTVSLIISDIDDLSMKKGVAQQKVGDVQINQLDYLGLDDLGILEELEVVIGNDKDGTRLAEMIEKIKGHLLDRQTKMILDDTVDTIICMPIYTQLLITQIFNLITEKYNEGKINQEAFFGLQRTVLDFMPLVIETLNILMLNTMKDQGTLLVFSDILEDVVGGPYDVAFQDGEDFDQLVEGYNQTFGMGLGSYGLYHLELQLRQVDQYWFQWPFDSNRVLFVKGIVFRR